MQMQPANVFIDRLTIPQNIANLAAVYANIRDSDNPRDVMQCIEISKAIQEQGKRLQEEAELIRLQHLKALGVDK